MQSSSTDHIFVSYSRKDENVMRRIIETLRKKKLFFWVDNENLVPGTPIWEKEIEKAISNSEALIVICSPDSKDSIWVRNEIRYAILYGKNIFPLLVSGDEPSSIPISLINFQFLDLRSNEQEKINSFGNQLIEEINAKGQENTNRKAEKVINKKERLRLLQDQIKLLSVAPSLPIMSLIKIYSEIEDPDFVFRTIMLEFRQNLITEIELMKAQGQPVSMNLKRIVATIDSDVFGMKWVGQ